MDERAQARLMAQVAALRAAVMTLMDNHQDRPQLAAHLGQVGEHLLSGWLNTPLSDEFFAEFQSEMARMQTRLKSQ